MSNIKEPNGHEASQKDTRPQELLWSENISLNLFIYLKWKIIHIFREKTIQVMERKLQTKNPTPDISANLLDLFT